MDFKSIVNAAAEAIFVLDKSGKFIFINRHALRRSGYTEKELIGRKLLNIIPRSQWKEATNTFNEIMSGKTVRSIEYSVRYKSGKKVTMEFTGKPLVEGGRITGAIGTAKDITKRKHYEENLNEARQMLRFAIDTLPMRIFWKDRGLRYLGCNLAFAKDAGFKSPDEIIGKTDFDMVWKPQAEGYRRDDRKVIRTGKGKLNYEEQQTSSSGKQLWLRTSKRPLRNSEGKIIGVLGVYEDITEQKKTDDKLKQKMAELERFQKFAVGRELRMVELKKELRGCGKK